MLKGAKKLKVSGILLIISSALVILFFLIKRQKTAQA